MEFIILGLLLLKPMSGYEMGRFVKDNLSLICSSSAGSVQSAIKKLILSNYIRYDEFVENGKNKKVFYITEQGKSEFKLFIQTPMQTEKVKNMELSKLFFLGFAPETSRKQTILDYIKQLENVKKILLTIKDNFTAMAEETARTHKLFNTDVLKYQGYLLKYGIASAEFQIDWYTKLLNEMEVMYEYTGT